MDIKEFLEEKLKEPSKYELSKEEQKSLEKKGIEEFIKWKLTSKKFRKWAIDDITKGRIDTAVKMALEENRGLRVVYPQGGYKLWKLPTTPEPDWAEFFNISYVLEYVAPIAAAYEPGVELTYYLHTLLMERHDNLTTKEIEAYENAFRKLLAEFEKYIPENIKIVVKKDADFYSREEYFKILDEKYEETEKVYNELPNDKKEHFRKLGELNIKWDGAEDWTKLSNDEKNKKIIDGSIYEMIATTYLDRVMEGIKGPDKILAFMKSGNGFIGIGSTRNSAAKHWVGIGILEQYDNKYVPRILSPNQYDQFKKDCIEEGIDLFGSDSNLKNFSSILIYKGKLNFSK